MLKSLAEILTLSTAFLKEHRVEPARRSAEELLAHVLGIKRIDLYLQYDRPLIESEMDKMRAFLKRASQHEPIDYIIGEVEFYGCRLIVKPDVLIPRKETEILVDLVSKKMKEIGTSGKTLWDLCTGSGSIGLGLKRAYPDLTVVLSDICPNALAVAQKNAEKNQLSVECRLGDLLQPFCGEKADFVTCNPPYISNSEFEKLDPSVRDFEPKHALLAGVKGVEFYEMLCSQLPAFLKPNARVFLEIGHIQGPQVQEIFCRSPWINGQLLKDWAGHDRFFFLEIE